MSVGSAIGWGSLVVTSNNYLSQAGPLGSILGLLIGFAMMLMVANHYSFLGNRYPGAGGLYNYVKQVFGFDRALDDAEAVVVRLDESCSTDADGYGIFR